MSGTKKAVCWHIEPGEGPPLHVAFALGEASRRALLNSYVGLTGERFFPDGFHRSPDRSHGAYFSQDCNGDGLIDRITVYAAGGVPDDVVRAAALVRAIALDEMHFPVSLAYAGPHAPANLYGPARLWRTETPFVSDRHISPGRGRGTGNNRPRTVKDQLVRRMASLGKPNGEVNTLEAPEEIAFARAFAVRSSMRGDFKPPPPGADARFATLRFPEPVEGPVFAGFGCHFGLGLFVAQD